MTDRRGAREIEREAARWVMRLDREPLTPADEAELARWLAGDVRRRGALLQAEAAWATLDGLGDAMSTTTTHRTITRRGMMAGGVGTAMAASVAAYVLRPSVHAYRTETGEVRHVSLQDQSIMAINTDSRVEVDYGRTRRSVQIEAGEAWFAVAKDTSRPFVVAAGRVRVAAVGTAFSVRRRAGGADVIVTEGVVETWLVGAEKVKRRLVAGSALFVGEIAVTAVDAVVTPAIERKLAWRVGQLNLDGDTLADAVTELNRYNTTPILVQDQAIAGKRLFGVFRLDDPEGFARTAAVTLGAQIGHDRGRIVIKP